MVRTRPAKRALAVLASLALGIGLVAAAPATEVAPRAVVAGSMQSTTLRFANDTISPDALLGAANIPGQQAVAGLAFPVANFAQAEHTVDVAVVAPAGTIAPAIDDAGVSALVANTGAYWKVQSNNQVDGLTINGTVARYASAFTCTPNDLAAVWTEAAAAFGQTDLGYYVSPESHHLLVIVPNGCGSLGIGTVGSLQVPVSGANGGLMWASLGGVNDLDIVAHEFGHNLGLLHSNSHSCTDPNLSEGILDATTGAFSDGCADHEYEDLYDLMGAAVSVGGVASQHPAALNVTHQARLDALTEDEVQDVSLSEGESSSATTATLNSTGAESGLRALRVIDPQSGKTYYVDFRGGGGADSGSLYERGLLNAYGANIGVRLLTVRDSGASVVFLDPARRLFLSPAESLSTRSGGIKVTVNSEGGGTASVTVTLTGAVPAPAAG